MKHIIEIKMLNHGIIKIELDDDIAPIAISNVLRLISEKAYDNRAIERLEPGFVIQPIFFDEGKFEGLIEPEFLNENNHIPFERGIVAMAGTNDKASIGQFFITLDRQSRLDNNFTVIGKVISGYQEIERIEKLEVIEEIDKESGHKYHRPKNNEIVEAIIETKW